MDKSLLRQEDSGDGEPRLVMLETIHEYARERLAATGEGEALRRRHAAYYLAQAEAAEAELAGPRQETWLSRLEREHDNLRAALAWSLGAGEGQLALQLAGALWQFWWMHGHLSEGRRWLEEALTRGRGAAPFFRGKALNGAGWLADIQGDYACAASLHEESLALGRSLGHRQGIAGALASLGDVAREQGQLERAVTLYEESLTLYRELEHKHGIAVSLSSLGDLACERADYRSAVALYEESLALYRELGHTQGVADTLKNLAAVAREQGDYARSAALYGEGLGLFRATGNTLGVAWCLEGFAGLVGARGQAERAARLYGAAVALRDAIAAPLSPTETAVLDRTLRAARGALGEAGFATAVATGREMPVDQAIGLLTGEAASV